MCHCCEWAEHVLLILIIVLVLFVTASWGRWVIFAAALILLIHKFACNSCKPCVAKSTPKVKKRKK